MSDGLDDPNMLDHMGHRVGQSCLDRQAGPTRLGFPVSPARLSRRVRPAWLGSRVSSANLGRQALFKFIMNSKHN